MSYQNAFGTVLAQIDTNHYDVILSMGARVEATYYGLDGASFSAGDRVFLEYADLSQIWTISSGAT